MTDLSYSRRERMAKALGGVTAVVIVCAWFALVAFVVIHFIAKYW